jgi:hypothetical protein
MAAEFWKDGAVVDRMRVKEKCIKRMYQDSAVVAELLEQVDGTNLQAAERAADDLLAGDALLPGVEIYC